MNNINAEKISAIDLEPFFELSPDLLCIAGYDGFFKRINPAVSKLLGYSNDELYARPINDFVFHEDRKMTSGVREQLTKSKPLYNYENRYVTKGGEIVWLSWTSLPVESNQMIFAVAKDITHRKKLEGERNLHLSNLTKANQDLKQLNYTTSHDLRAPVNNLLSIFDLLDVSKITDTETLEFINMLKSSAENLKQILNGYVDALSQKEILNEQVEEVHLNESLNAVLHSIRTLILTSKATFHIDFSEQEKVKFNKVYLDSIFLNLVTNSIKYSRIDCSPVITIFSRKTKGISQLIISDNGLGFDMDKVKGKIFGFQQKFHNHIDSKGIGLYLVYNHITALGGQIEVESKVNGGSTFTISFKG